MELTVKELAARERVGERTVRRWINEGKVPVRRTPGGGIRIVEGGSAGRSAGVICPSHIAHRHE